MAAEKFANEFASTLTSSITDTAASMSLNATVPAALQGGQWRARIDSELVIVTADSGSGASPLTVTRGAEGTTQAAHSAGATVTHVLTVASLQSQTLGLGDPNTQTADYTLVLADAGTCVEMNSASAKVITIPANASVAFPIGTVIEFARIGTGSVTITPGSGVTIPNRVEAAGTSSRTISSQYSSASVRKRATNEWHLVGDIA